MVPDAVEFLVQEINAMAGAGADCGGDHRERRYTREDNLRGHEAVKASGMRLAMRFGAGSPAVAADAVSAGQDHD